MLEVIDIRVPRAGAAAALCLAAVGLSSMPASAEGVSSLPPPLEICGQALKESALAGVSQFSHPGEFDLRLRHRRVQVLRFSKGCSTGVSLTIAPKRTLLVLSRARVPDGRVIAIVIEATKSGVAHVTARRPNGARTIVDVHVAPANPGTGERNEITTG